MAILGIKLESVFNRLGHPPYWRRLRRDCSIRTLERFDDRIEGFFDETLTAIYTDETPARSNDPLPLTAEIPIARGTDGLVSAFSKVFTDEDLAIQTQFHIAESYFELFKSHLELARKNEAAADLKAGRKVLSELAEDYPDPRYKPRIEYLLGNFSQEMEQWDAAIASYKTIVRDFPEHTLAATARCDERLSPSPLPAAFPART